MQAAKLFDTPLIIAPNMSDEELQAEWDAMIQRSLVTQSFIDGKIDVEYFFDWMAQHGYEPSELICRAEENLEFAINEGLELKR